MAAQSKQGSLQLENARDRRLAAAVLEDIRLDLIDEVIDFIEQREIQVDQRVDQRVREVIQAAVDQLGCIAEPLLERAHGSGSARVDGDQKRGAEEEIEVRAR